MPWWPKNPLLSQVELISEHEEVAPGKDFDLVLAIKLAPDWHVYWKNPGDAGMAPSIEWQLPKGVTVVDTEWPVPERFEHDQNITFGYSEKAPFLITMHVDPSFSEEKVDIQGTLQWVVCSSDTCLPGSSEFKTKLSVGEYTHSDAHAELFDEVRQALPKKVAAKSVEQKDDQLLLSFNDDEIAMNDAPLFFPRGSGFPQANHHEKAAWRAFSVYSCFCRTAP